MCIHTSYGQLTPRLTKPEKKFLLGKKSKEKTKVIVRSGRNLKIRFFLWWRFASLKTPKKMLDVDFKNLK